MTLAEALARYPGAVTFTFGDSRALCDDLVARVRSIGEALPDENKADERPPHY